MEVLDYHPHYGLINKPSTLHISAKIPQDVENVRVYFGGLLMSNVSVTDDVISFPIPPCKDLLTLPIAIVYDNDKTDDTHLTVGAYTFVRFIETNKTFPKINPHTLDIFKYQVQSGFLDNAHETRKCQSFDINYVDPDGKTNLHHAAYAGNLEAFHFLQNHGGNVHIRDYMGNSILHDSIFGLHYEIISSLIKSHVDINAKNNWGDTPLHFAAARKDKNVFLRLLKNGADLNEKNKSGKIPNDFWEESYELVDGRVVDHRIDEHCLKKRKTVSLE